MPPFAKRLGGRAPTLLVIACLVAYAAGQSGPWISTEPYWPHYPSRKVTQLTGTWRYGFVGHGAVDPMTMPYSSIVTPNLTTVPSTLDIAPPGVVPDRGTAFFRSTHACTPGSPALIKFGAVNFYARVFADGVELGDHTAGGYTPFEMIAPACLTSGSRELAVVVNTEQNKTLSPTYTGGDFYFFSGIIRPVFVTELPCTGDPYISRVEPTTVDAVRGILNLRVVMHAGLCPPSQLPATVHLAVGFHGASPGQPQEYPVVDGAAVISSLQVPQPWAPWTVAGPNGSGRNASLVQITVLEGASGDTVSVRTGIRVVAIDRSRARITINGEVVKLLGFNRHTMWPDTGAAVTPAQEAVDMELLIRANVNYIRGAHYPQSQSWLDLCDENGVAMWEETLGPGTSVSDMTNAAFMKAHLEAVGSMVETSIAHPSVILHGFFNEGPSDNVDACVGYAASAEAVRSRVSVPASRLVTWANNHLGSDKCMAYEDVISFNAYPGWYDHAGNITYVAGFWASQIAWVDQHHPEMPFTVSETGGGGIWEWINATSPPPGPYWSQTYQRALVSADATAIANSTRVSALSLWQFSDIKVANCAQCDYLPHPANLSVPWDCAYIDTSCGRPGGENHKGSVDYWRREKLGYASVARIYADNAGN